MRQIRIVLPDKINIDKHVGNPDRKNQNVLLSGIPNADYAEQGGK